MAQNVLTIVGGKYTETANLGIMKAGDTGIGALTLTGTLSGAEAGFTGTLSAGTVSCATWTNTGDIYIVQGSTGGKIQFYSHTWGQVILQINDTGSSVFSGSVSAVSLITTPVAFASLPAGVTGMRAFVNNALAPVFGAAVAGGGAVTVPVYYNGATWNVG